MKKGLKISLIILGILVIVCILFTFIFINKIMKNNDMEFNKEMLIESTKTIEYYDVENNKISGSVLTVNTINIADVPQHTIDAFVSIEDKDFFNHDGLNYKRIAKAIFNNVISLRFKEGASTISQQLIKNTHLSNEKTINRKIKEMILTKKLEDELSKKDILETYLNVIYFGKGAYGLQNASNLYFNCDANELSLEQSAVLAGIIKAPNSYCPITNIDNCKNRRNLVLSEMLKDEKITNAQYDNAINTDIDLDVCDQNNQLNYDYILGALSEAEQILNLTQEEIRLNEYKIYTNLNAEIQQELYAIVTDNSSYNVNDFGNINDSLMVVIDNETNNIIAYAGNSIYDLSNFKRQPGSAIKPILAYAPAIEKGILNGDTLINDEPIDYNGYSPRNLSNKYYGYVTVKDAVSQSLNIPAVKSLEYAGIMYAKKFSHSAGINYSEQDNGLAIALGGFTDGITLNDLTNSYTVFANDGNYQKQKFISSITDKNGKILYTANNNREQIMGSDTAYIMTDILHYSTHNGTSKRLSSLDYDIASKTGTVSVPGTNDNTDAYCIAYTTEYTIGCWVGNYSNEQQYILHGNTNGGTICTDLVKNVFNEIYSQYSPDDFVMPESVEYIEIDNKEYLENNIIKLCNDNCPERYKKQILVSSRHNNYQTSTLFDNLSVENFNAELNGNTANISFYANDCFKYEIIRVSNNKETIITEIKNKKGLQNIADDNLDYDSKYQYFVKCITLNDSSQFSTNTIELRTQKQSVIIDKIVDKNQSKQKSTNWIFR